MRLDPPATRPDAPGWEWTEMCTKDEDCAKEGVIVEARHKDFVLQIVQHFPGAYLTVEAFNLNSADDDPEDPDYGVNYHKTTDDLYDFGEADALLTTWAKDLNKFGWPGY